MKARLAALLANASKAVCAATLLSALSISDSVAEPRGLDYASTTIRYGDNSIELRHPSGYKLDALARMRQPRLITPLENGDLLIGSRSNVVYRVAPPYSEAQVLLRLKGYPHSVALRENTLYIATTDTLFAVPYTPGQSRIDPDDLTPLIAIPGGRGHNSRTVRIGPDKRIYLSLGISGNCSNEYIDDSYAWDKRRGGVMVLDESRQPPRWRAYANGLRNPVGFDWHPRTGVAYASNNGPDHLGYEEPREVFAKLAEGSFHGMPWFQYMEGRIQPDRCMGKEPPRPAADVVVPAATFPARNAPMGVAFIPPGTMSPRLEGDAVVALRGSWGTPPDGSGRGHPSTRRHPKLVLVRFEDGEARRVDDLLTGFQFEDGSRWARPVGVAIGRDGNLYFTSDSGADGLYRLRPVGDGN
ncbi:MAG: PQQ-dependent sugar dehydrogenase [Gammaproteobacteria bacterium]